MTERNDDDVGGLGGVKKSFDRELLLVKRGEFDLGSGA